MEENIYIQIGVVFCIASFSIRSFRSLRTIYNSKIETTGQRLRVLVPTMFVDALNSVIIGLIWPVPVYYAVSESDPLCLHAKIE